MGKEKIAAYKRSLQSLRPIRSAHRELSVGNADSYSVVLASQIASRVAALSAFGYTSVAGVCRTMHRTLMISLSSLALLLVGPTADAAPSEKRLALVIGNAAYRAQALATPVNDAALVAQTLQTAGFDVTGVRDLDGNSLRQAFRDFVVSLTKAGPDTVAAVYFAGYGLQLEGENYLMPIDTYFSGASDVALRTLRLSDQMRALGALHLKATFVMLDAARVSPFRLSGQPLAGGLAWVEPESNMLIAFNAAPGTVAPNGGESYGPYAKALAEMIREGGLTPANVFDRVRLRVHELTKGAQVPWHASKIETQFIFLERGSAAPPQTDAPARTTWMRSQPMRSLGPDDSYMVALLRDTFDGYTDFLADHWNTPMAKRVWALLAARREAITWRRTYQANVSEAYWSYLKRYPRGPHTADAGRLLAHLGAAIQPPAQFAAMDYDVPSPLPDELKYIERPTLVFDDPDFAFAPPPPSPAYFLAPSPPEILVMKAPAASDGSHSLPRPAMVPLPVYVSVPASSNPTAHAQSDKIPTIGNAGSVANTLDGQAASSSQILPPGMGAEPKDPADSPRSQRSVAALASPSNSQSLPPEATPEETNKPMPVPGPEMFALPAPGSIPLLSRATVPPPITGSISLPIPRPAARVPPAADGIPLPTPRPRAIASQGQPIPRALLPPTAATGQAAQPSDSSAIAHAPKGAPGVLQPPVQPCPVVNGRRICS
jgi:uncharacterized caspase-like protein